jgi:hypothetical protein
VPYLASQDCLLTFHRDCSARKLTLEERLEACFCWCHWPNSGAKAWPDAGRFRYA